MTNIHPPESMNDLVKLVAATRREISRTMRDLHKAGPAAARLIAVAAEYAGLSNPDASGGKVAMEAGRIMSHLQAINESLTLIGKEALVHAEAVEAVEKKRATANRTLQI